MEEGKKKEEGGELRAGKLCHFYSATSVDAACCLPCVMTLHNK